MEDKSIIFDRFQQLMGDSNLYQPTYELTNIVVSTDVGSGKSYMKKYRPINCDKKPLKRRNKVKRQHKK